MQFLLALFRKARHSAVYRWLLNRLLWRIIPFNRPHRFRITRVGDDEIEIHMPYRRRNFNHLRGLHACGLATVAEYATGLLLISNLDPTRYRIIMKSLAMEYHFQGRMEGVVRFSLTREWIAEHVTGPLEERESIVIEPEVGVYDVDGNHLATGRFAWQIKRWDRVRTPQS